MDQDTRDGLHVMRTVGYSATEAAKLIIYVNHDWDTEGETPEKVAACADLEKRLTDVTTAQGRLPTMSNKKEESTIWPKHPLADLYSLANSEVGNLRLDPGKAYRTVRGDRVVELKPSGDAFSGTVILHDGSHKKAFWHKNGRVLNTGNVTDWDLREVPDDEPT